MLDHLSVEEIQKNINNRQISIKEVLVYYLERIEETQKVNLKNLKNPPASQASGNVNTK